MSNIMNKIFFTSDLHLNHLGPKGGTPLWESRGYSSFMDMTDKVISRINETIEEDDVLYHLGDFCLNTTTEEFESLISRMICKNIYMIHGNHNNPHFKIYKNILNITFPNHQSDEFEVYPIRYKNVTFVGHYKEIVINKQLIVLFHYPISSWNHIKHGSWMLCGHSHHSFNLSRPDNTESKILDVGWDGFKKPLSFEEVKLIMDKKNIAKVDHHY